MNTRRFAGIGGLFALWVVALRADEPTPPVAGPDAQAIEVEKLRAAIVKDMQSVEKKLQDADAGADTRGIQKRILENLDKLLNRAKNPPPQDEQKPIDGSQPMGSDSKAKSQPQPQPGPSGGSTRRERREAQRRREQQAKAGGKPRPGSGGKEQTQPSEDGGPAQRAPTSATPRPDGKAEAIAELMKDIWGHLPETMRQEVDRYYRVQFMPRYRDLVEQYYLRLAETDKRKKD